VNTSAGGNLTAGKLQLYSTQTITTGNLTATGQHAAGAAAIDVENVNLSLGSGLTFNSTGSNLTGTVGAGTLGSGRITSGNIDSSSANNIGGGITMVSNSQLQVGYVRAYGGNNGSGSVGFAGGAIT